MQSQLQKSTPSFEKTDENSKRKDLTSYFDNLKKEFKDNKFKKDTKTYLAAIGLYEIMIFLFYLLCLFLNSPPKEFNNFFVVMQSIGVLFTITYWTKPVQSSNLEKLTNKDKVNFYDALNYLYRHKKDMTENEFKNFINSQYEIEFLEDILKNAKKNISNENYTEIISELNNTYQKKEVICDSQYVLERELKGI